MEFLHFWVQKGYKEYNNHSHPFLTAARMILPKFPGNLVKQYHMYLFMFIDDYSVSID